MQHTSILVTGVILFVLSIIFAGIYNQYFVVGHGIKIVGFMEDSPAQKAGIVVDDAILAIDGLQIKTSADFIQIISTRMSGEVILVQTLQGLYPVVLAKEPVFGNGRLGVFVETIKTYPQMPVYADFTIEQLLSIIYWLGMIHLIAGFALIFGRTAPLTEFFALNTLNVLDLVSTHYFLQLGRVEGNPAGIFLLENLGFYGTAVLKIIVVFIASALFIWLSQHKKWHKKSLARTLIATHRVHIRGAILLYLFAVLVNIGVTI
ncbi:MAG: PDZ domain-containing protein [Candidatus Aenigmarchaeota archaeon]|nr:PDZ domain-containing protein [Candidatus Aenigmarchaeota archaeon]